MQLTISLPEVKEVCNLQEAKVCVRCGSSRTMKHSREESRIIRDTKMRFVERIRRYCKECKRTYTVHPQGLGKGFQRSQRLIFSCALMYLAGLSYDKASAFLSVLFQTRVGAKSTLWGDVQRIGENMSMARIFTRVRASNKPTIIGNDGTFVNIKGKEFCVEFICDHSSDTPETESLLKVGIIASENSHDIYNLIQSLAQELDLSNVHTIVSDDGAANHKAVEMLNGLDFPEGTLTSRHKPQHIPHLSDHYLKHQLCLAHTKKNILKRLSELKNKTPPDIFLKLQEMIASNLHPDYLADVERMVRDRRVHEIAELHEFLFGELWPKYTSYGLFWKNHDVPRTNNRTERTIGRTKVRYKLCRGLKSLRGALHFTLCTQAFEAKRFNELLTSVTR